MRTKIDVWTAQYSDARDAGLDLWEKIRQGELEGPESRFAFGILAQAPRGTFTWEDCIIVLNHVARVPHAELDFRAIDAWVEKTGGGDVRRVHSPSLRDFIAVSMVAHGSASAAELSDEVVEQCAALALGDPPLPFIDAVLVKALSHVEHGRAMARAASDSPAAMTSIETLDRALHYATALEAVRIILRATTDDALDHAWDILETRRDEFIPVLLGEKLSGWDRTFGPNTQHFLLSPSGVVGFSGFVGLCAALTLAPLGSPALTLLAFLSATLGTRYTVRRPRPPQLETDALLDEAMRPAAAGLVGAWIVHAAKREDRPPPDSIYAILSATLDDPIRGNLKLLRGAIAGENEHLGELSERKKSVHLEAIASLSEKLHKVRRELAGRDPGDPRALAEALLHPDTRATAAHALGQAPRSDGLAKAAMEVLATEVSGTTRKHAVAYAFRHVCGLRLRHASPTPDRHRRLDDGFAEIAELLGVSPQLKTRLIWNSGDLVTPRAQALIETMLAAETRTEHSPSLIDACTHFTPGSRRRASLELSEREHAGELFLAALGDDASMWEMAASPDSNATVILRRHAGPGAMLGLWRIARGRAPGPERRAAYQGLLEFATRYRTDLYELLDQAIATAENLGEGAWRTIAEGRLEDAMVARTRWSASEWRNAVGRTEFLAYARAVVWGLYDPYDRLVQSFRVDESNELVDVDDELVSLAGHLTVGVATRNDLSDPDRRAWSGVFADYELVSPIRQLAEEEGPTLDTLSPSHIAELVDSCGWLPGHPDHGRVFAFLRPFLELGVTAVIEFEPGLSDRDEPQEIVHLSFIEGVHFEEDPLPRRAKEDAMPATFAAARHQLRSEIIQTTH